MLAEGAHRTASPPAPPPPPPPPERHVAHRVEAGETLTEIAARYRTTVAQLEEANPELADPDRIDVGQVLQVPIGEGYGAEPQPVQVEPGQTLSELARQVQLPLALVVAANRHELSDPDLIQVGQEIWIPGGHAAPPAAATPEAPPPMPLEQLAQATDAAAVRAAAARQAYDEMAASTYGRGAALPYLAENAAAAERALDAAVQAELQARADAASSAGGGTTAADRAAAAAALQQRPLADASAHRARADAVARVEADREAQAIVDRAAAESDPERALAVLNEGHAAATPAVQQVLLADAGAQAIVDRAANWALEPLAAGPDFAVGGPQVPGLVAMERLDALAAGGGAVFGARVLAAAAPGVEAAMQEYPQRYGTLPFGPGGVEHMVGALGRIAGTPQGDAVVARYAGLGIWDAGGVTNAIAQGASPAYAIALARQPGIDAARVMDAAYAGMAMFRDRVGEDAEAYGRQIEELGWLVANHGGAMTPEQLEQAIADYTAAKGVEWQRETERLERQFADDGAQLLAQLQALQDLPPELSGEQTRVDDLIAQTLDDPQAQLAITAALRGRPELTEGAAGRELLGFFASSGIASNAKLTDQARKLVGEIATAHVRSTLFARIGEFDPTDAASVQRAAAAIDSLRSPELARAWGVSEAALDKALAKLAETMPAAGESAEATARRLRDFDAALDAIKGFDRTTGAGQLLRGAGLALAGVGVLASIERAGADPSLKNGLRALVDAAGLGQKGAELLAGLSRADSQSLLGRLGGSAASKFLGVLTAAMDVWNAADSFANGDIPSGVLYGVGAGGGVLAAFGAGSIAGPIGIGLVVLSVIGLGVRNGVKEANRHEPGSDGGASMRFLQHAGFSAEAARALCDQSGEGHSAVPILARYAELRGLDLGDAADRQRFVDWIDAMPPERLAALRDSLHRTLDEFDGDATRLQARADDDAWAVADTQARPWFAAAGAAQPESALQIDAVLQVLQLPLPPAS